jgi:SAM-dependent methyltransferase
MTHSAAVGRVSARRSEVGSIRRAYSGAAVGARLHVAARAATCPLAALEALVPDHGDVLDLGCGHGLLSILMALSAPHRCVWGVDVDPGKIAVARAAARHLGLADRVRFDVVDPGWSPAPRSVGALVVVDVLYLLDDRRRDELIAASVLAVGHGTVVIKEMADRPRWKRALTAAQEHVSVHALGITSGDRVALPREADLVGPLVRLGAAVRTVDLSRGRPHPHLAIVARCDARGYAADRP